VKRGFDFPLFFVLNFEYQCYKPLCDCLQKPPILDGICDHDEVILDYEFLENQTKNWITIPLGLGSLSLAMALATLWSFSKDIEVAKL
jgi:hypothetical protein